MVLSAKNAERLKEQAEQLVAAIEQRSLGDADLADVAYTLQVGREAMESRLGLTAASMAELVTKLQGYLAGETGSRSSISARPGGRRTTLAVFAADEDMAQDGRRWVARGQVRQASGAVGQGAVVRLERGCTARAVRAGSRCRPIRSPRSATGSRLRSAGRRCRSDGNGSVRASCIPHPLLHRNDVGSVGAAVQRRG